MRINFSESRRFRAGAILSTLALSVGCGSISKNRESDFLKPLASSNPSEFKRDSLPSERSLCIETAKTVAGKGHAAEAIQLYDRAEQLDPTAAPLDAKLAPLYADVGKSDAAIERYKRSVQLSPKDCELANNFAWTLMEAGRFDQAITEANRGLQIEPNHVRLRSTLAMIHYRQGDLAGALRHFEQAYGLTAAHHNLAILEIDAGNHDSAKMHLQLAKQSTEPNTQTELLALAFDSQTSTR
ncbi:Tfp pilus assembly protein PilF [Neorhodopirellula lusitana]|uniref:Tfp pilus assembly protein PilF n=1 Tax=Neorhodopirellula lusitana TaxID=445327 RepID=A0ABY1Q562_9BACT|nr:tetratricopeptide repeat protein [Neorhodopirellula lusitana]SMP60018.1 Tfp pilus assembly protein PilF [Neorhodopirellula lusitana]